MRVERIPAALFAMLLIVCGTFVQAHAEPGSVERIAHALEGGDHVHVDPAYADALSEETLTETEGLIADSGLPVRVLLVPLVGGDRWGGDADRLAAAVHERIGDSGHYLLLEEGRMVGADHRGGSKDRLGRAHYAALAANQVTDSSATLNERVLAAVEFAVAEDPEAMYEELRGDVERTPPPPSTSGAQEEGFTLPRGWWVGVLVLAAAVLFGGYVYRTRRRAPPALPHHAAFVHAAHARREELVDRAERELVEVGQRLTRTEAHGEEALAVLKRALDRHAAARTVLGSADSRSSIADLAGVLVLLDLAEDALARAVGTRATDEPRPRHCYANPLHGTETTETDWRQLGGSALMRVPLCASCAESVRRHRRPDPLRVVHGGQEVPYYEVPAEESVWSATGFGTLTDDLVPRIQRGDHGRGRG